MVHHRQAESSNEAEPKPTSDRVSSVSTREIVFWVWYEVIVKGPSIQLLNVETNDAYQNLA